MANEEIIALYEKHAEQWIRARLHTARFDEKGWLDRFCTLMSACGTVLDYGCGAGEPIATYLTTKGHAVVGVDSSPAMIRMFRTRLPEQHGIVGDMRSLSLKEHFEGILAWDSFFHLNYNDQRRMFPQFAAHAAPGTALMFTSGPAHGESIGTLEGEPLYHASLAPAEYRSLLEEHGFTLISTTSEDLTCGNHTVWLAQAVA